MHYELSTSKSSSAIARPHNTALHLIDCFRRFGKSKSKKRLFSFGFNNENKQELDDSTLNIDHKQKSRRFGSTPNVHSCRTEFLHFTPSNELPSIPNTTNNMNQSCYGGFPHPSARAPIANYDNMSPKLSGSVEENVRRNLMNRRSRKAVSEVGCPITVVEVGNSRKIVEEQLTRNDEDVCWRSSLVDSNRLLREQRRSQYFDNQRNPNNRVDHRRRFSNCKLDPKVLTRLPLNSWVQATWKRAQLKQTLCAQFSKLFSSHCAFLKQPYVFEPEMPCGNSVLRFTHKIKAFLRAESGVLLRVRLLLCF